MLWPPPLTSSEILVAAVVPLENQRVFQMTTPEDDIHIGVKTNARGTTELCGICGTLFDVQPGAVAFIEGTTSIVCGNCLSSQGPEFLLALQGEQERQLDPARPNEPRRSFVWRRPGLPGTANPEGTTT